MDKIHNSDLVLFLLDQNSGCKSLEMIGFNTLIMIFGY